MVVSKCQRKMLHILITYTFCDLPKFCSHLVAMSARKAMLRFPPYLNSVTPPKSVYSDDLIISPPVKETDRFEPNRL
jgi:hypothetical protein